MTSQGYAWRQTTVAKTEAAERPLRINEVGALALVFGVGLADLLDDAQREIHASAAVTYLREQLREAHDELREAKKQLNLMATALNAATGPQLTAGGESRVAGAASLSERGTLTASGSTSTTGSAALTVTNPTAAWAADALRLTDEIEVELRTATKETLTSWGASEQISAIAQLVDRLAAEAQALARQQLNAAVAFNADADELERLGFTVDRKAGTADA